MLCVTGALGVRARAPGRVGSVALLEVEDLHVSFRTADGIVQAVRGVSFHIDQGETLGIVGESGSGKSVSTQTIMGLTRGASVSGRALFEGRDLLTMKPEEMRRPRREDRHDLPGPALQPASLLQGGLADRGDDPAARSRDIQGTCAQAGRRTAHARRHPAGRPPGRRLPAPVRSEEDTSELQSRRDLVCRLLLEKKKKKI